MYRVVLPLVAAVLVTQIAVVATSVYLHRGLAHRALALHPFADWLFRLVLWISTGQNRREWVAVHRKHHAFADREGDPHSPLIKGFWKVQLGNVFYYIREARNREVVARWARDIRQDAWDRLVFDRGTAGAVVGVSLAILAFGPLWGCAMALTHFILYVFVLAPAINGLGHWWGRRNFDTNAATNIRLLAWFTGGESLHNNHHAYPSSPKFSIRRFEFDPSWVAIRLLMALKLVSLEGSSGQTMGERRGVEKGRAGDGLLCSHPLDNRSGAPSRARRRSKGDPPADAAGPVGSGVRDGVR